MHLDPDARVFVTNSLHDFDEGICFPDNCCYENLEIFTSGRYHRDMKILKMLASTSKRFRVYDLFKK